jgi:serine/threonine protein kinase
VNRRTGEKVAIKVINKKKYWQSNIVEQVKREVEILKQLRHPNIISIIEIISTGTSFLYSIMMLSVSILHTHMSIIFFEKYFPK